MKAIFETELKKSFGHLVHWTPRLPNNNSTEMCETTWHYSACFCASDLLTLQHNRSFIYTCSTGDIQKLQAEFFSCFVQVNFTWIWSCMVYLWTSTICFAGGDSHIQKLNGKGPGFSLLQNSRPIKLRCGYGYFIFLIIFCIPACLSFHMYCMNLIYLLNFCFFCSKCRFNWVSWCCHDVSV